MKICLKIQYYQSDEHQTTIPAPTPETRTVRNFAHRIPAYVRISAQCCPDSRQSQRVQSSRGRLP
ncbi:hypothetical protein Ga0080559_TMP4415 [Salipiger profundus]|uniref:Uncharacterized protein n=1 Tax=Salipiger profundus TaxID=1229727 RepID=A0A1U7DAM4_9RHOB|nr:hypothetical protein Ga0080559_TMP4415 [Salipiger profundus]